MSAHDEVECPHCGALLQLVWTGQANFHRQEWHAVVDKAQMIEAQNHDADQGDQQQ